MNDNLEKALRKYVDKNFVEYGQYIATVRVDNGHIFRVVFEHYVDVDEYDNVYDYIDIFKGRRGGCYVGKYSIINIELLQHDY